MDGFSYPQPHYSWLVGSGEAEGEYDYMVGNDAVLPKWSVIVQLSSKSALPHVLYTLNISYLESDESHLYNFKLVRLVTLTEQGSPSILSPNYLRRVQLNEKNIQNDYWRLAQLGKSTADPTHDFSKFGTGNKETLDTIPKQQGINVRDAVLQFHAKWYSANIMALVVLGKESLNELEEMVLQLFIGMENKNVTVPEWTTHPFCLEQCRKAGYVVPVRDDTYITCPILDLNPHYNLVTTWVT
ncbi:hypothetical protein Pcinc_033653 [Petrolisthes cinctipes]|uniref:Peptidase M16 C-terminal domain-containing protein n=1 Tax=Petrolisthes cinctipes TaxID=88211 RepID=A0AAE1ERZ9_PETCI|nr:hypothetical protein Pcinc_033653 [Petrolisthes cinctipes]